MSQRLDPRELELAEPPDPSGRRVVPFVAGRAGTHGGGLRLDLDTLPPRTDARKVLAKGEQQLRVAFQAHFSSEQRSDQALFLRKKPEPGLRVRGDVDGRLTHESILDLEG